jgi:ABC-type sugar transport system substrate-binding protein
MDKKLKVGLAIHSRTKHPTLKSSSVWGLIYDGFAQFFAQFPRISYFILPIIENYNDIEEYLEKVEEAIKENPDVLVLPLTPKQGEFERRLLIMLKKYKGIIIAINVPPDENAMRELNGNLRGYVGMHEIEAGRKAALRLFSSGIDFDCIYFPNDKLEHYGYSLRRLGAESVAKMHNIPVCQIDITNTKNAEVICACMDHAAFISFGPVGTSFAIEAQKRYPTKVAGIVAIDLDQKTAEAIKSQKVICALIQHPREQGARAAELAVGLLAGTITSAYTQIYCGPTIVDLDNISIFE